MSHPAGYFITGTDTGVGKTIVAAALVAGLRSRDIDAVPMKPVQTGCDIVDGVCRGPDLEFCLGMAGYAPARAERPFLMPYGFEPACSPHLAAARAGVTISLDELDNAVDHLAENHEVVVVEGAGGVLVPLNEQETMLDMMERFSFPAIVVTRPGLGTLNHTLLTLEVLRQRALPAMGVVMVSTTPEEADYIVEDNIATLRRLAGIPVCGPIPYLATLATQNPDREMFLRTCLPHLEPLFPLPPGTHDAETDR